MLVCNVYIHSCICCKYKYIKNVPAPGTSIVCHEQHRRMSGEGDILGRRIYRHLINGQGLPIAVPG